MTTLADRLALRLAGRARGASRLELTIAGERGERVVPLLADGASSADALIELIAPQIGEAPGAVSRLRVVVVGEAIAEVAAAADGMEAALPAEGAAEGAAERGVEGSIGDANGDAIEHAAEGMAETAAEGSVGATIQRAGGMAGGPIDALSAALSAASGRIPRPSRELDALVDPEHSLPWQLSAPSTVRAERRDAHRRTRRARQRRRTAMVAQSQLFGQGDG